MSLKQTRTKFGIEQPEGDVLHNADEILKTATITWVTSLVLDTLRTCKDKIKLRGLLAKDLENKTWKEGDASGAQTSIVGS